MAIKKGDFIVMDFTGKLAEDGRIFDTTVSKTAKDNNIFQASAPYEPVTLVVGERHVVPGLDDALVGKGVGKFSIKVSHEEAFGKKSAQLLKIIPLKDFKKQNIKPFVGLEVNVDGMPGIVRSLSGGRTVVDFNHPLASRDLEYDVDVKKIITSNKEKVESLLKLMSITFSDLKVEGKKGTVVITMDIPDQIKEQAANEIERLSGIKIQLKDKKKKEDKQT